MKIKEDSRNFYIHLNSMTVRIQRKFVHGATDNALSMDEEIIIMLCNEVLNLKDRSSSQLCETDGDE